MPDEVSNNQENDRGVNLTNDFKSYNLHKRDKQNVVVRGATRHLFWISTIIDN